MRSPDGTLASLPNHRINVTPMIDVMLVLLSIFMIVTPMLSAPMVLPRANHADAHPEEPDEIILGIDREGNYFLSASGVRSAPDSHVPRLVPLRALGTLLTSLYG